MTQKRKNFSLEDLEKKIEQKILKKLQESGQINGQENKNKPQSGHVEAGKKWSQSEAGMQWKAEIDAAQKMLDELLVQKNFNMSASGTFARQLAGKIRDDPNRASEFAEEFANKIIESKKASVFKQPKPVSPQKLTQNNVGDPLQIPIQNNNENPQPIYQENPKTPLIGGFFDDSSDDEA